MNANLLALLAQFTREDRTQVFNVIIFFVCAALFIFFLWCAYSSGVASAIHAGWRGLDNLLKYDGEPIRRALHLEDDNVLLTLTNATSEPRIIFTDGSSNPEYSISVADVYKYAMQISEPVIYTEEEASLLCKQIGTATESRFNESPDARAKREELTATRNALKKAGRAAQRARLEAHKKALESLTEEERLLIEQALEVQLQADRKARDKEIMKVILGKPSLKDRYTTWRIRRKRRREEIKAEKTLDDELDTEYIAKMKRVGIKESTAEQRKAWREAEQETLKKPEPKTEEEIEARKAFDARVEANLKVLRSIDWPKAKEE